MWQKKKSLSLEDEWHLLKTRLGDKDIPLPVQSPELFLLFDLT